MSSSSSSSLSLPHSTAEHLAQVPNIGLGVENHLPPLVVVPDVANLPAIDQLVNVAPRLDLCPGINPWAIPTGLAVALGVLEMGLPLLLLCWGGSYFRRFVGLVTESKEFLPAEDEPAAEGVWAGRTSGGPVGGAEFAASMRGEVGGGPDIRVSTCG